MSNPSLEDFASLIPQLELSDLRALEMATKVAIQMRSQGDLTIDSPNRVSSDEEGPGLNDQAEAILSGIDEFELTLADQALLASLILGEKYHQDAFSSRDINDIIEECGRPRVAHITSAIAGLTSRSYLVGEDNKSLKLSKEGRAKARSLIGMVKRKAAA